MARTFFNIFKKNNMEDEQQVEDVVRIYFESTKDTKGYYNILSDFMRFLEVDLDDFHALKNVDSITILKYISWQKKQDGMRGKRADNTIRKHLNVMKSLYSKLHGCGIISRNPFTLVPQYRGSELKRNRQRISNTDVSKILDIANVRDRAILSLLFGCALRLSEALELKKSDIFENHIRLRTSKAKKSVDVALSTWVKKALDDWLKVSLGRDYIFYSYWTGGKLDPKSFNTRLKKYAEKIGLSPDEVSSHQGRITVATELIEQGCDIIDIKNALRHSSTKTTEVYIKKSNDVEKSALLNLKFGKGGSNENKDDEE
jgi:site-specific recombinase XerD